MKSLQYLLVILQVNNLILLSQSIGLSFLKSTDGRETAPVSYQHAGPDLACEIISLRDRQYLQDQLDVFNILREFSELTKDLDVRNRQYGWDSTINNAINQTAKQFKIGKDFWQLATTDIPWQLGEGTRFSLLDTDLGTNAVSLTAEEQILSRHPRYANSVLVRALFQCYHRADGELPSDTSSSVLNPLLAGYVLTMSPTAGINFLDRNMLQDIQVRPGTRAAVDDTSFVGAFMKRYCTSGTKHWPAKTPEWFIVDMITQLLITPHSLATGRTVPEIQNAYLPLVRDLVGKCSFASCHSLIGIENQARRRLSATRVGESCS